MTWLENFILLSKIIQGVFLFQWTLALYVCDYLGLTLDVRLLEILDFNCHLSDHSIRWCISRCSSWWLTAENNTWWSFLLSLNRNNFGNISLDNSSSISGWRLITLNKVFPDPEPAAINILYGWSGICCQLKPLSFIFYFVTSTKLILFCIVLCNKHLVFFFFTY